MCRNIKMLNNLSPSATDEDIEASAAQYVRKLSGIKKPTLANQEIFDAAIEEIAGATKKLLNALELSKVS
jgi:hypothetical protein